MILTNWNILKKRKKTSLNKLNQLVSRKGIVR